MKLLNFTDSFKNQPFRQQTEEEKDPPVFQQMGTRDEDTLSQYLGVSSLLSFPSNYFLDVWKKSTTQSKRKANKVHY